MSSQWWTERQGQVDLRHKSKEELRELLLRQQRILSNKKLLDALPDRGQKTERFAETLRLAIEHRDEEEKKQAALFAARNELQFRYKKAFTKRQHGVHTTSTLAQQNGQSNAATSKRLQKEETAPASAHGKENIVDEQQGQFNLRAAVSTKSTSTTACPVPDQQKERDIVESFEMVTLDERADSGLSQASQDPLNKSSQDNYFLGKQVPQKQHYMVVLEKMDVLETQKQKFKPNQLPQKTESCSSGSSSPSESAAPLHSEQAMKKQDEKHLDDICAARIPALICEKIKVLSMAESVTLLDKQTRKQQELQAKQAGKKLSEGLGLSMMSYTPDGGPMAAYREVHDNEALISSDED
ncbi:protein GRINL1A [Thalassophryne amazonica]|uniref:protein GRINL1A n=1 Tax=Thalassophryne amazonica TaxID=390379 RepID=UPI001471A42C|nr:protein GRINL1A [Thalassophryne amazonica]